MAAMTSRGGRGGGGGPRRGGGGPPRRDDETRDLEQRTLDLSRVTRVTKGGKRMRFRACVIVGDGKGRVGYGVAKGIDVSMSVNKAARRGARTMIRVPLVNGTIPHTIRAKFGAAVVLLKPAPKGTGIKAGGAARVVLELAGVPNVVSKTLGSANKINNVKATMKAIELLTMNVKEGRKEMKEAVAPTA